MPAASLPYHEPSIEDILILSTFLLALNLANSVLDRTLYCGLVGQVFVGVAWGTPGGGWLSEFMEHAIVQLGNLGLIMIVFEGKPDDDTTGGSSSSIPTMRANLALSTCVALTGIAAPMALSFLLGPLAGATALQSFAAGAALCSTSLGTTFTVLSTSGLASTRLGSVLSTAAMMDDVVGLVMVQIVSSGLGDSSNGGRGSRIAPAVVLRPVLVSVAFAVVVPLVCRFVFRRLITYLWKSGAKNSRLSRRLMQAGQSAFLVQTAVLLVFVAAAGYAGASVLLAAYLAGIVASWWRDERTALHIGSSPPERDPSSPTSVDSPTNRTDAAVAQPQTEATPIDGHGHQGMYSTYYGDSIERILKPFFFASVGFSIPLTRMFNGAVVWRGIIYAILMVLGKTLCGAWLIRLPMSTDNFFGGMYASASRIPRVVMHSLRPESLIHPKQRGQGKDSPITENREQPARPMRSNGQTDEVSIHLTAAAASRSAPRIQKEAGQPGKPGKPLSLYPSGIVSCAMVARGEIGFLISSVAESKGIFRGPSSPPHRQKRGHPKYS
ncbi:hypothetical protein PG999_002195 [Apiospora kogelbergensis]|uniref:Cation/H+ exchanger transmembrane domain-containing protein n=1 Tax=Apiospora kogelbergensis TaxID=1337665 RepID=A0AAW0R7S3_9PEZI